MVAGARVRSRAGRRGRYAREEERVGRVADGIAVRPDRRRVVQGEMGLRVCVVSRWRRERIVVASATAVLVRVLLLLPRVVPA